MKPESIQDYSTRNRVLRVLSDAEIARLSTAEAAAHLEEGDEFLDLENLNRGVQRATGTGVPAGRLLPKKSVHLSTWRIILARLAQPGIG